MTQSYAAADDWRKKLEIFSSKNKKRKLSLRLVRLIVWPTQHQVTRRGQIHFFVYCECQIKNAVATANKTCDQMRWACYQVDTHSDPDNIHLTSDQFLLLSWVVWDVIVCKLFALQFSDPEIQWWDWRLVRTREQRSQQMAGSCLLWAQCRLLSDQGL